MNRRSLLQLTPLVDVLLILLFAVIINVQHKSDDMISEQEKLKDEFKELNVTLATQKENNKKINEIITKIFKIKDPEIKNDELNDSRYILNELIKYDAISDNISVIDLSIGSENNRIYINSEPSNIYITYEEVTDSDKRKRKIEILENAIVDVLEKNKNNKIILITLGLMDNEVYKYAYDLTEKIIKNVIKENVDKTIIYTELLF